MQEFRMRTKGGERKTKNVKIRELEEDENANRANNRKKCNDQNGQKLIW
jgi:hypothetical protein